MSLSNSEMKTQYAITVSKIDPTAMSNWVAQDDNIIRAIFKESIPYGKRHIIRKISTPKTRVKFTRELITSAEPMPKETVGMDLVCINDRDSISRVDYAGDPSNVQNHVGALGDFAVESLDLLFTAGSADPLAYGALDAGPTSAGATDGTKERPAQVAATTGGNWGDPAVMRGNVIEAVQNLVARKFDATAIIAPRIVKPMIMELITGTAVSAREWFKSAAGLPIYFSDYIHPAATKADFNIGVIDGRRVGIAGTDMEVSSWFSDDMNAYVWQLEGYAVPAFNFLGGPGAWFKGVSMINACSWEPVSDRIGSLGED